MLYSVIEAEPSLGLIHETCTFVLDNEVTAGRGLLGTLAAFVVKILDQAPYPYLFHAQTLI